MRVEVTLDIFDGDSYKKIEHGYIHVISASSYKGVFVELHDGEKRIVVRADELQKAIQNCINQPMV